ncbi:caspase family protein [Okeanomitos corallinicola TIOX110]|uniref:Caspase family protein n=1 Tax=Okeanomitos corallinicola TIOX110 TaxID=3133117 RepID=A0ABZ2UWZ9_9CYAN
MSNNVQFLIVGVNHHYKENRQLGAAERDAQAIFNIFKQFGLIQNGNYQLLKGKQVTPNEVNKALDHIGNLTQNENDIDLLFIYWAGHGEKLHGGGMGLLTYESKSGNDPNTEMVKLETLVGSFSRFQGFKNYVLILDTCYSGEANEIYNKLKPSNLRQETRYEVLAACERTETAKEDYQRHGWLTEIVLNELKAIFEKRVQHFCLSDILAQSPNRLKNEKDQTARYTVEVNGGRPIILDIIPPRATNKLITENTVDFLETALGYTTQGFCKYLKDNVVQNVELIYFLGFDVWDGCLVYDGLINGSIEAQLLEFIRQKFLDRDRLRSRYEEKLAENDSTLGIAGQCLKNARDAFEENLIKLIEYFKKNDFTQQGRQDFVNELKTPTLEGLQYIGNLDNYPSEYENYDLLLGLQSCLYIPVIEPFFDDFDILNCSKDEIQQKVEQAKLELSELRYGRKPLGGVLIAANRKSNGIKPLNNDTSLPKDDSLITQQIRGELDGSQTNNWRKYKNFRSYLKGINAVYREKSVKKISLRQGLHPSLVKRSIKNIKEAIQLSTNPESLSQEKLGLFIDKLAQKVETDRLEHEKPLSFADSLNNGVTHFRLNKQELQKIQVNVNKPESIEIIKIYVLAILWRDLRIEQEVYESTDPQIEQYLNNKIIEILQPQEVQDFDNQLTLESYIAKPILNSAADQLTYLEPDDYPEREEVSKKILLLINNLLDDLREVKKHPSELVYQYLQQLAPIKKYVDSVANLEGIFGNSINQRIFCDLSHGLSVWLLGLWILESQISTENEMITIKKQIVKVIESYFHQLPKPYNYTFRRDIVTKPFDELREDFITVFWGIIAASHDIAVPVQRFKNSCEQFFGQFFGQETIAQLKQNLQFNIIDVLDHPRFPIYKNAITSLYSINPDQSKIIQRDWLECVFYRAVSKNIEHSTVSSLILIHELEPYSDYCHKPAMWKIVKTYLNDLSNIAENEQRREYGLFLPAYLAHAVAFSDLPKLQKLWEEMQNDWQYNEHLYFEQTANKFKISFEEYPLSYLLGLLETILEPSDESNRLDERIIQIAKSKNSGNNDNYEDFFDYHSHFYINNVAINQRNDKQFLSLSLKLWENNMKQESQKMSVENIFNLFRRYKEALVNINNDSSNNHQNQWSVYSQQEYDKKYETDRNKYTKSSHIYHKEFDDTDQVISLSPRAYKVLEMICRLHDFFQNFQNPQWKVMIEFDNVIHVNRNPPTNLIFPDDLPDDLI